MKKFIILGEFDIKILLPFLSAAFLILSGYLGGFVPKAEKSFYISDYGTSCGFMLVRLIPLILKYKAPISFSKNCNKGNIIDYSLFFLFYAIFRAAVLIVHFTGFDTSRVSVLCSNQSLEIIVLLIVSRLILKYTYHIHNIISLLLFCIFSTIIDLIAGNLSKLKSIDFAYSGVIIAEDIFYCYMKYMLDNKYHKYWDLIFFQGVFNFIYNTIAVIIRIRIDDDASFISNYFSKEEIGAVSAIFFFNLICTGIIQQVLNVIIINIFSPSHMLIAYVINKIKKILFNNTNSDNSRFYCLIPFVFQILSLLFYLEIFEYNFCDLNKNTKRNIRLREIEEMNNKGNNDNYYEISDDLYIKNENFEGKELATVGSDDENDNNSNKS